MENEDDVQETSLFLDTKMESKKVNSPKELHSENIDDNPNMKTIFYAIVVCLELVGILCFALVLYWTKHYFNGFAWDGSGKEFNYHPLFMVTGMVLLYGNAAIAYRVFRNQNKYEIKLLHGGIHLAVFVLAVLGLVAVFDFHNANKIPNMYSLHSWIGIGSVSLFACQLLFGFVGFLYPTFSDDHRRLYLKVHVYFGIVIFALAIAACIAGFTEKILFSPHAATWSKFKGAGLAANILVISLLVFGLLVSFILYNPSYKRVTEYIEIK